MTDEPFVRLPKELLVEIYELVRLKQRHQYHGLVSRAFLPIARDLFFRNVHCWRHRHVVRFNYLQTAGSDALCSTRRVKVTFEKGREALPQLVFTQIPRLTALTLCGKLKRVTEAFTDFLDSLPPLHLPNLNELVVKVNAPVRPAAGTVAATRLLELERYTRLTELRIDLRVFSSEPWSADETLSLPSLETLEITSRDNSTTFVGPLLAAAVTELVNLYITDPDELSPAASLDILRALKAPQNLLLLSFSFGEMLLFEFPPSSVSALSGLETIEFARGSWSSSLLHSLCWLPRLAELYVDAVSGMSTAELRALVLPGTDSTLPSSST